jgi:microcystin-dependent protein
MKPFFILITLVAAILARPALAADGAAKFIEYQGRVFDSAGAPLAPTTPRLYKMEFRLWDQIEGGTLIWSEQQFVNVSNGAFSVRLGEGQAATDTVAPLFPQDNLPAAFTAKTRFLGLTVVNPPAPKAEISPRLAMLSAPYALVANEATSVIQGPGTFSTTLAGMIAYSTQTTSGQATVNLTLDKRVNMIFAGASGTIANLPSNGDSKELVVIKTDNNPILPATAPPFVTVKAPSGGLINGTSNSVYLKVKGDSITVQNTDGNNWWIVKDSRDSTQVGTIIAYGGATPPKGYLACDGTAYADLFAAIGTTWGATGIPSPTSAPGFNVPNLDNRFIRGLNPGSGGADEDAGARFALYVGGSNAVGSYQLDSIRKHAHSITDLGHDHTATIGGSTASSIPIGWSTRPDSNFPTQLPVYIPSSGGTTHEMAATASIANGNTNINRTGSVTDGGQGLRVGSETRPDSAVVRYCIKY